MDRLASCYKCIAIVCAVLFLSALCTGSTRGLSAVKQTADANTVVKTLVTGSGRTFAFTNSLPVKQTFSLFWNSTDTNDGNTSISFGYQAKAWSGWIAFGKSTTGKGSPRLKKKCSSYMGSLGTHWKYVCGDSYRL